ncbi:MAG: hypothetical protein ACE14W_06840 [Candidatus Velamenicoccus archaeovorus]
MIVLGVGGTTVVGPGSYNFWPLLFIPLALVTLRFALRFPLGPMTYVAALVVGTGIGWSVGAWGVLQPFAGAVLVFALATLWRRPRNA